MVLRIVVEDGRSNGGEEGGMMGKTTESTGEGGLGETTVEVDE